MKITWEYIAGFFDGEGYIGHNGKGYRINISQTNYEVLNEIRIFVGCGNVFKNKKREIHWKESWVYYIARQEEVYYFLKKIIKYLIVKKVLCCNIKNKLKIIVKKQIKKKKILQNKIKTAKKFREQKFTYREIGKKLDIDWGYARRLILK